MFRTTLTAAIALTALTAGTAFADCNARMGIVEQEYGKFIQSERRANADNARVIQDLRNAARRLSAQGNEEGCEAVVDAIEDVAAGYRDMSETGATGATTATTETATNASVEEIQAKSREDIEARVVPLADGEVMLDTSNLKGTNVYNYKDEFLGEVAGMLVVPGKAPTHLIVGHGGFWNIGEEEAAIPLGQVKWDPEWQVFYVNISEEQLEKAPDYDQKEGKWVPDNNDQYYSKLTE